MTRKKRNGVLLDTHTWIWLFNGCPELSQTTINEINKWGQQGKVFISAISVWELSMLVVKQRVILSKPINQWVEESLKQPGVSLVHLFPEIAIESSFLPGNFHGDPADRIICATSRINNLILFTRDKKILSYGEKNQLACHEI
jgi:PIN domain nuclease of toxin-antitoxin system